MTVNLGRFEDLASKNQTVAAAIEWTYLLRYEAMNSQDVEHAKSILNWWGLSNHPLSDFVSEHSSFYDAWHALGDFPSCANLEKHTRMRKAKERIGNWDLLLKLPYALFAAYFSHEYAGMMTDFGQLIVLIALLLFFTVVVLKMIDFALSTPIFTLMDTMYEQDQKFLREPLK